MKEFDEKAATWDDDPKKVERATSIASIIKDLYKGRLFIDALEYGSGTGLLGFELLDIVSTLTLMDESAEMIKVAAFKASELDSANVDAVQYDLLKDPLPKQKFDIIFTLLTMHHIDDTQAILTKFNEILKPGGLLLIIDLEKEDGSFHDGDFNGHLGFEKKDLESKLYEHSLKPMNYLPAYSIVKTLENDSRKEYPLFLSISQKIN